MKLKTYVSHIISLCGMPSKLITMMHRQQMTSQRGENVQLAIKLLHICSYSWEHWHCFLFFLSHTFSLFVIIDREVSLLGWHIWMNGWWKVAQLRIAYDLTVIFQKLLIIVNCFHMLIWRQFNSRLLIWQTKARCSETLIESMVIITKILNKYCLPLTARFYVEGSWHEWHAMQLRKLLKEWLQCLITIFTF